MTLQIIVSLIDAARGVIYDRHMFIVQATDHESESSIFQKNLRVAQIGAGHVVHIFTPTCLNPTLCQNVMFLDQFYDETELKLHVSINSLMKNNLILT